MVPDPFVGEDLEQQGVGRPGRRGCGRGATPARTARAQASTLGIIPVVAAARCHHGLELVDVSRPQHAAGSSRSRRSPATSVRKTSFSASSAAAMAPATASALML